MIRFVLVLLFPLGAMAGSLSPAKADALRARFEARQRETRTWSAGFVQTLTMRGMRTPVVSEGTITYRAPDSLRIDFQRPAGEFVLAVGDRLFIQKAGKKLVEKSLSNDTAGKPIQSLLGLLQGRPVEAAEDQYETQVSDENGTYLIVLTKKQDAGGRLPRRITNVVSNDLSIREVRVEMPKEGSLVYSFREAVRNRGVEAEAFSLPIPK